MECENSEVSDLEYLIHPSRGGSNVEIIRQGCGPFLARDDSEILYLLEKDLTIELQKLRPDLYFLHAAALAFSQSAFLLVAPSGGGKSTTAWALLHHGFSYLSDELSPVDLSKMEVHSYPHAICLKKEPPAAYPLPRNTVRTPRTLHIPTRELSVRCEPAIPTCIFFLDFCSERTRPVARELSRAEAAARLYTQALNPLAHVEDGLQGAVTIAQSVPCVHLLSADLGLTCELIHETVGHLRESKPVLPATPNRSLLSF